ncbi:unnamed protein product [Protopolystoma xenopodis]|uniref:Uncharacterized protein n=1 Tax=Protopolystoma xenopodis TaxID=117903 RepID=A0A448XIX2_9PLAT|nr:unnamed protein product [Protopolystoma xenopodis]
MRWRTCPLTRPGEKMIDMSGGVSAHRGYEVTRLRGGEAATAEALLGSSARSRSRRGWLDPVGWRDSSLGPVGRGERVLVERESRRSAGQKMTPRGCRTRGDLDWED